MNSSQSESEDWRRSEPRIPIDLGSAPFLGSRENGQPSFAYLLRDVRSSRVGVIVPLLAGMGAVYSGESVNFHLPFQLDKKSHNRCVCRCQQMIPRPQTVVLHLHI